MGARMVPANGQTTKTKKIFYMSFWLERLSILLQIYTFACNFCSQKGGCASIGYRASIGTYVIRYVPKCEKFKSLAIWRGGGGGSIIRLGPSWFTIPSCDLY